MAITKAANPNAVPCTKCKRSAVPFVAYPSEPEDWVGPPPARIMEREPSPPPAPRREPVCWPCYRTLIDLSKRARRVLAELVKRKPLSDPASWVTLMEKLIAAPDVLANWETKLGLVPA